MSTSYDFTDGERRGRSMRAVLDSTRPPSREGEVGRVRKTVGERVTRMPLRLARSV